MEIKQLYVPLYFGCGGGGVINIMPNSLLLIIISASTFPPFRRNPP